MSGLVRKAIQFRQPTVAGRLTLDLEVAKRLNSEDRGLKVRFSLAMIVFETFELILCQMPSSQGEKRTFKPLSSLFSAFSNLKGVDLAEPLCTCPAKKFLQSMACSCETGLPVWWVRTVFACICSKIGKGFLQSEVLGEVSVLEGGSLGRSFWRSLRRGFSRSFRAYFSGTFGETKTSAKTSAQNSHDSAQQNCRNIREKLHDEGLQVVAKSKRMKIDQMRAFSI